MQKLHFQLLQYLILRSAACRLTSFITGSSGMARHSKMVQLYMM